MKVPCEMAMENDSPPAHCENFSYPWETGDDPSWLSAQNFCTHHSDYYESSTVVLLSRALERVRVIVECSASLSNVFTNHDSYPLHSFYSCSGAMASWIN